MSIFTLGDCTLTTKSLLKAKQLQNSSFFADFVQNLKGNLTNGIRNKPVVTVWAVWVSKNCTAARERTRYSVGAKFHKKELVSQSYEIVRKI